MTKRKTILLVMAIMAVVVFTAIYYLASGRLIPGLIFTGLYFSFVFIWEDIINGKRRNRR